ncbi:FAD-dependent oxidoreductase [Leptolyngbya sp. 7M]|uniref:FAD-dependent oxidoreductase n=1 Tax=Leptolyngbya sp. 7M TaxID=2812896 RepID=UPI001B8A9C13|nr:FAD-dependent oxidoreductase [Leptolyngbya sp. 7M]QYO62523.1 FAD-dependent oxidoreductase [Leptolyngbya sp. 7M]
MTSLTRPTLLNKLRQPSSWDIIVIGGGATGLGTAVEAASRGYRTLLLEKFDFAKGTSSRSTKLVHGGVRYLAQGNLPLVQEALYERGVLRRNAPHLVKDLTFVVPAYTWWSQLFYGAGLKLYDFLAGRLSLGPSRWLNAEATLKQLPTLKQDGLRGGILYHDGQFDDARLAITLLRTLLDLGGLALNYAPVIGFSKTAGQITGVQVQDAETGETLVLKGNVVVNATGEGCGVVVVKRLSDALAAGDRIWALIRGSAVNQDGRSSGLTVPNGPAQQAVIRQALANAGIAASEVGYIEAHGTGTALGDPIELLALGEVFKPSDSNRANKPLLIGSVKTNLGHLEAAAGIAGLIKVALSLHYREIPPHLHFQQPNPHVPWERLPLQVPTVPTSWPSDVSPIAGVSSFGFSGTNAHVVLSAVETSNPDVVSWPWLDQPPYSLTLSAKTPAALQALTHRYYEYLRQNPTLDFAEICYQVKTGRSLFAEQLTVTASSTAEAIEQLGTVIASGANLPIYGGLRQEKAYQLKFTSSSHENSQVVNPKRLQPLLLPTYPFQRQCYWVDIEEHKNSFVNRPTSHLGIHPLLGQKLHLSRSPEIYFSHRLSQTEPLFLAQHRVLGASILPASGYIEMALAAGKQVLQSDCLKLVNLSIQQPITLTEAELVIQVVLSPQPDGVYQFEVLSQRGDANWQLHATGSISQAESFASEMSQLECPQPIDLANYYQTLQTYGIEYGELFQAIQQLWRGDRQARGQIRLAAQLDPSPYQCHPVLLDAAFQVIGAALPNVDSHSLYLPIGCDQLTLYKRPERTVWTHVRLDIPDNVTEQSIKQITVDLQITDTDGELIATIAGLHLRPAQKSISLPTADRWQDWLYQINWQAQPLPNLPTPTDLYDYLLPQLSEWLLQPDVIVYPQVLAALERLSITYIRQALQQLGWTSIQHLTATKDQQLGIAPQYQRLLHRLVEILHQAEQLEQSQSDWNLTNVEAFDLDTQVAQLQQHYPTATAELTLLHFTINL